MRLWIALFFVLVSQALPTYADHSFTEKPDVKAFIEEMVQRHRFNRNKLLETFKTVELQPQIIESIKNPLEKETWRLYERVFITPDNIKEGALFRTKYHNVLIKAEKKYGIPASIIIATLGVETKYGKNKGNYRVLDSLSSLAFTNERRAPFFRRELKEFLLLTREQKLNPLQIKGSYAGAIGAPQFMPSSYREYADTFAQNKHVDLIHNINDSIASIGNYYKKHGWKTPQFVAVQAAVKGSDYLKLTDKAGEPITFNSAKLSKWGITPAKKIAHGYRLKLLEFEGSKGKEFWLVFPDFEVIKRYNASNLYAMAVFQLSRQILQYKEVEKIK